MKIFIAVFSFVYLAGAQEAWSKPVYRNKPPKTFCDSGKTIGNGVESCEGNSIFLQKAQDCWKKLEALQENVTRDLQAIIGAPTPDQQNAAFLQSKLTYEEGNAAQEYMYQVTKTALAEVDAYFDFVVYPEHAESDEEIMAESCFKETVVPLNEVANDIQEKLVGIVSKIETSDRNANALGNHSGRIDSLNEAAPKAKVGAGTPASAPKGKKRGQSDISGEMPKPKR